MHNLTGALKTGHFERPRNTSRVNETVNIGASTELLWVYNHVRALDVKAARRARPFHNKFLRVESKRVYISVSVVSRRRC